LRPGTFPMIDGVPKRILLVEGDPELRQTLTSALSLRGRDVTSAGSARDFRALGEGSFDLAILDLNLPDDSGFAIIRELRESGLTWIVVHTGRDTLTDRVEAYTQGADIYMVKPTPEAELLAAVDSLLKRGCPRPREEASGWRLDKSGSLVAPGGEKVALTHRQVAFMKCLMGTPGKAVPRDQLRRSIGIVESDESGRALDMFVTRLRRDIEEQVKFKAPIETVPRQGFAFRRL